MHVAFFRSVEVAFTAYAVPALIVPLFWLFGRRLVVGSEPGRSWEGILAANESLYGRLAAVWIAAGVAVLAGVRVDRGGEAARVAAWLLYLALNVVFARLLVRFTAGYGHVKEDRDRDRLFGRLLVIVVAHPLVTAVAFFLLYRVMGLSYDLSVPGLGAVQEGI